MKKKIICMLMIPFLIINTYSVLGNANDQNLIGIKDHNIDKIDLKVTYDDLLDQSQENDSGYAYYVLKNYSVAQSFTPTLNVITRVELYLYKFFTGSNYELFVSIRSDLDGDDLTTVSITPDMGIYGKWIEFDLPDIKLEVGTTYWIICSSNQENDLFLPYGWIYLDSEISGGGYDEGLSSLNNPNNNFTWEMNMNQDTCFRTYGIYNDPPANPEINGQISGKAGAEYLYTFNANDPNDDNIYLNINWGDGTPEDHIGPFPSNEEQTSRHVWVEQNNYIIKVKAIDSYGAESEWTTLEISMPKIKSIDSFSPWISRLIERFPILKLLL